MDQSSWSIGDSGSRVQRRDFGGSRKDEEVSGSSKVTSRLITGTPCVSDVLGVYNTVSDHTILVDRRVERRGDTRLGDLSFFGVD